MDMRAPWVSGRRQWATVFLCGFALGASLAAVIALAWLHVSIRANGFKIHEPDHKANPMLMRPAPERPRLQLAGLAGKNSDFWLIS